MIAGSLFSGIEGFGLGLLWSGLITEIAWQVELDPFCRRVLERWFPRADRSVLDVRAASASSLRPVDLLFGGPPCQDVSGAGKGEGLTGARSGLVAEMLRLADELRPAVVLIENVASGARRWVCPVRGALEALGYRTAALNIGVDDCGGPHRRKRVFVLAYACRKPGRDATPGREKGGGSDRERARHVAHPDGNGQPQSQGGVGRERGRTLDGREGEAHPNERRRQGALAAEEQEEGRGQPPGCAGHQNEDGVKPRVGRNFDGISNGMDRGANANAEERRPGEVLRALRLDAAPEAVQRATGGPRGIPSAEALRNRVLCPNESRAGEPWTPPSRGQDVAQRCLREVRGYNSIAGSPRGSKSGEQRAAERDDTLHIVPHEMALGARQAAAEAEGALVFGVWRDGEACPRSVWSPLSASEEARRSNAGPTGATPIWPGWPAGPGPQHAWEPPRVLAGVEERAAKLKALGNAVSPIQAYHVGLWAREVLGL